MNGIQMNLEMQVRYYEFWDERALSYLCKMFAEQLKSGNDLINWMHFFNGKHKEDFESMAKTSEYLGEAYNALQKLSADDIKRLEYEEREKAIRDHNWIANCEKRAMERAEKRILERAEKRGEARGETWYSTGKSGIQIVYTEKNRAGDCG